MNSKPQRRKVEFIESYWTGGDLGSDYVWNDNHGGLVRCRDCKYGALMNDRSTYMCESPDQDSRMCVHIHGGDWYCADAERRDDDG
jgi:hypothetical protein